MESSEDLRQWTIVDAFTGSPGPAAETEVRITAREDGFPMYWKVSSEQVMSESSTQP